MPRVNVKRRNIYNITCKQQLACLLLWLFEYDVNIFYAVCVFFRLTLFCVKKNMNALAGDSLNFHKIVCEKFNGREDAQGADYGRSSLRP